MILHGRTIARLISETTSALDEIAALALSGAFGLSREMPWPPAQRESWFLRLWLRLFPRRPFDRVEFEPRMSAQRAHHEASLFAPISGSAHVTGREAGVLYGLGVLEAKHVQNGYGEIADGTQYSLGLVNGTDERVAVAVTIDGQSVGTWMLAPRQWATIERPAHIQKRFTFFRLGTEGAKRAELEAGDTLGLLTAEFTPERRPARVTRSPSDARESLLWGASGRPIIPGSQQEPISAATHAAGGTGLTGQSTQAFRSAPPMALNESRAFLLHLRLVCRKEAHEDVVPLSSVAKRSTPIPPPI